MEVDQVFLLIFTNFLEIKKDRSNLGGPSGWFHTWNRTENHRFQKIGIENWTSALGNCPKLSSFRSPLDLLVDILFGFMS